MKNKPDLCVPIHTFIVPATHTHTLSWPHRVLKVAALQTSSQSCYLQLTNRVSKLRLQGPFYRTVSRCITRVDLGSRGTWMSLCFVMCIKYSTQYVHALAGWHRFFRDRILTFVGSLDLLQFLLRSRRCMCL